MAKSKTKSISFKERYKDQYEFLLKQDNPSGFVCELIKKHMEDEDDFESKVKDVLIKYFANTPQVVYSSQSAPPIQSPVEDLKSKIDQVEDPW